MSLETLKLIRLIVPGIIIFFFTMILGNITGLWHISLPDNLEKAAYIPSMLIPGAIYYLTPLRSWTNARHHKRLIEHLRTGLVSISEIDDRPEKFTWPALKSLFFSLVDLDASLKTKASLAYFNGAIWTTCADLTILGIIFGVISFCLFLVFIKNSLLATLIFIVTACLSYFGSLSTTRKQITIASEQLEIIRLNYKNKVVERIGELDK